VLMDGKAKPWLGDNAKRLFHSVDDGLSTTGYATVLRVSVAARQSRHGGIVRSRACGLFVLLWLLLATGGRRGARYCPTCVRLLYSWLAVQNRQAFKNNAIEKVRHMLFRVRDSV
jgi:hypothetical protein